MGQIDPGVPASWHQFLYSSRICTGKCKGSRLFDTFLLLSAGGGYRCVMLVEGVEGWVEFADGENEFVKCEVGRKWRERATKRLWEN